MTSPLHESRLQWIHDPHLRQSSSVPTSHPPASTKNHPVPRINDSVPRNIYQPPSRPENVSTSAPIAQSSDVRVRAPLTRVDSSVWHNSSLPSSQEICPPVPRNNMTDKPTSATGTAPPPPKRKRNRVQRRERRAREREERARIDKAFIHDAQ